MTTTVSLRGVTLGEGRPKVIIPLTGTTRAELRTQTEALSGNPLDIIEWRVDFFEDALDADAVVEIAGALRRTVGNVPVLATFRTADEGGEKTIAPEAYADLNIALVRSGAVDAVDVEFFLDEAQGRRVQDAAAERGVKVVLSSHDFEATPPAGELVSRLRAMQARGGDVLKVAVMPRDAGDVLALLQATHEFTSGEAERPVIAIAMGGLGVVSRMAGGVFGSAATFGSVGRCASAPGQVPADALVRIVRLVHGAV